MAKREKPSSRRPRLRKWAVGLVLIAALITLLLYVGVPVAVRYGGAAYVSSQLNGEVTLGSVGFDPWSLTLDIEDAVVTDPEGVEVARTDRIIADAELRSLWSDPLAILRELRLVQPHLTVVREADGSINLLKLPIDTDDDEPSAGLPLVEIKRMTLEGAVLEFEDRALDEPLKLAVQPADVTFEDLSTAPGWENVSRFTADVMGGTVTWDGRLVLDIPAIRGELKVKDVGLADLSPYALYYAGYTLVPGTVAEAQVKLDVALQDGRPAGTADVPRVVWQDIAIDAPLDLIDRGQLNQLVVTDLHADLNTMSAVLSDVALRGIAMTSSDERVRGVGVQELHLAGLRADLASMGGSLQEITLGALTIDGTGALMDALTVDHIRLAYLQASLNTDAAAIGEITLGPIAMDGGPAGVQAARVDSVRVGEVRGDLNGMTAAVGRVNVEAVAVDGGPVEVSGARVGQVQVADIQADLKQMAAGIAQLRIDNLAVEGGPMQLKGASVENVRVTDIRGSLMDSAAEAGDVAVRGIAVEGGPDPLASARVDRVELAGVQGDLDTMDVAMGDLVVDAVAVDLAEDATRRRLLDQVQSGDLKHGIETLVASLGEVTVGRLTVDPLGDVEQVRLADLAANAGARQASLGEVEVVGVTSPEYGSVQRLALNGFQADAERLTLSLDALTVEGADTADYGAVKQVSLTGLAADGTQQTATLDRLEIRGVNGRLDGLIPKGDDTDPATADATGAGESSSLQLPPLDARLNQVEVADVQASFKGHPLVAWDALVVDQVAVSTRNMTASVDRVSLQQPFGYVGITESGESELKPLTRSEQVQELIDLAREVESATVGDIRITGGRVQLEDRSAPEETLELTAHDVNVQVDNVLRDRQTPTTFIFSAGVGEGGQIRSEGRANPLAEPATVSFNLQGDALPLRVVDGYARRYLGHGIERGSASLNLSYDMTYPVLTGSNDILLDQFFLGGKVPSDQALNVPVKLGLGLLRDRSGQIKLRVPIEGHLDNPSFDFRQVVTRALVNILVKTVTSPFSMLAGLVSRSDDAPAAVADATMDAGEDRATDRPDVEVRLSPAQTEVPPDALSVVDFPPGSAEITSGERRELARLAGALLERPELQLVITGEASAQTDVIALLRGKARDQITTMLAEQRGVRADDVPADAIARAYEQAIRAVYRQIDAGETVAHDQLVPRLLEAARTAPGQAAAAQVPPPSHAEPGVAYAQEIDVPLDLAESTVFAGGRASRPQLLELARQRAQAVQAVLVEEAPDLADRLAIGEPNPSGGSRVSLSLSLE